MLGTIHNSCYGNNCLRKNLVTSMKVKLHNNSQALRQKIVPGVVYVLVKMQA